MGNGKLEMMGDLGVSCRGWIDRTYVYVFFYLDCPHRERRANG